MTAPDPITLSFEHAQRLFDLATDSPLVCSGSFETDDVRVLRHLATLIGVDPAKATPEEFVRDFPHPFVRRQVRAEPIKTGDWVKGDRILAEYQSGAQWQGRMETVEEQRARMAEERTDETCQAGPYSRRCGRPDGDPIHAAADHQLTPHAQQEIAALLHIAADPQQSPAHRAVALLTAHQRWDVGGCLCGWNKLGSAHAGHLVEVLARAGLLAAADHHARPASGGVELGPIARYLSGDGCVIEPNARPAEVVPDHPGPLDDARDHVCRLRPVRPAGETED